MDDGRDRYPFSPFMLLHSSFQKKSGQEWMILGPYSV
jgi:hypothetical protein